MFDNFYLWKIRGISYWEWNFKASVNTSLIRTQWSLLCITQVLPTRLIIFYQIMKHTYIIRHSRYISLATRRHDQFYARSVLELMAITSVTMTNYCSSPWVGTTIEPSYGRSFRSRTFWLKIHKGGLRILFMLRFGLKAKIKYFQIKEEKKHY